MLLIFDNIRNIDHPAIIGYPANYRQYCVLIKINNKEI